MKFKRLVLVWGILLTLSIVVVPVFAQGGEREGKVIYGKDFTLESGEELYGDLAVLGGDLELEEDSAVDGDVVVLGGSAEIAGRVAGNVAVTGGKLEIEETAVIEGDVVVVGGKLDVDENAVIKGEVTHPSWGDWGDWKGKGKWEWGEGMPKPPAPPTPPTPLHRVSVRHNPFVQFVTNMVQAVIWTLIMGVLAIIVALFLPKQTQLIKDTITAQPIPATGTGVLALISFPIVAVILSILIITICIPPIIAIVLLLAGAWGWIAMGWLVGDRLLAHRPEVTNPLTPAVMGTALITLAVTVTGGLRVIPCIGFLFGLLSFIIGIVTLGAGIGAVLLSKFGTSPYPWSAKPPAPVAKIEQLPSPQAAPETKRLEPEDEERPHGTD